MKVVKIMKKLLVFPNQKTKLLIKRYKSCYHVLPMSALMNESVQLVQESLDEGKHLIDISNLARHATMNGNYLFVYESWINSLIDNNDDIEFVSDDSVADAILSLFPYYFEEKELLFEEVEVVAVKEKKTDKIQCKVPRGITSINHSILKNFIQNKKEKGINVISISEFLTKNNMLEYEYDRSFIDIQKKYMIDISILLKQLSIRKDYALHFEIILLDLCKLDNIEFCILNNEVEGCKNYFYYLFDEYKDADEEIKSNTQSPLNKSIAEYTSDELNIVMKVFSKKLFGHSDFKNDLYKQLKAFAILNKMKRDKIFSILLCGRSGIVEKQK